MFEKNDKMEHCCFFIFKSGRFEQLENIYK